MPKIIPPEIVSDINLDPVELKIDNSFSELEVKRNKLEKIVNNIWKGTYMPKESIEVIWRLFNEPKKQG